QPVEYHARHFDVRDPDLNDPSSVYDVYEKMRERGDLVYSDSSIPNSDLGQDADGHWQAVGFELCGQIVHDWAHFTSNTSSVYTGVPERRNFIFLDPPLQQQYRKMVNVFFSPRRIEGAEGTARRAAADLVDNIIEDGAGDLAKVAWHLPGTVLFSEIL